MKVRYLLLLFSPPSSTIFLVYRAFPHGKEAPTLAAVACVIVSFGISIGQFEIETHIPGFLAMALIVATTFTRVPASGLIAAAVLSFVNAFYATYVFVMMVRYNPCKLEEFRSEYEDICNDRPMDILFNFVSSFLWSATGLLVLKIPQPGNYERGQTAGAMVQSLIEQRVIKMGCCDRFG